MLGIIYMVARVLVSDFINFALLPTCSRHEETWIQQSLLLFFRISQKKKIRSSETQIPEKKPVIKKSHLLCVFSFS